MVNRLFCSICMIVVVAMGIMNPNNTHADSQKPKLVEESWEHSANGIVQHDYFYGHLSLYYAIPRPFYFRVSEPERLKAIKMLERETIRPITLKIARELTMSKSLSIESVITAAVAYHKEGIGNRPVRIGSNEDMFGISQQIRTAHQSKIEEINLKKKKLRPYLVRCISYTDGNPEISYRDRKLQVRDVAMGSPPRGQKPARVPLVIFLFEAPREVFVSNIYLEQMNNNPNYVGGDNL